MSTGCQKDRQRDRQTARQTDRQKDRKIFQLTHQNKSYSECQQTERQSETRRTVVQRTQYWLLYILMNPYD